MPHLTLEYSSNIIEQDNFTFLFQQCHKLLAEKLPTELASCKSRAFECKTFLVGDGHVSNAFIHVDLKVMPGRTQDNLQNIGQNLMELFTNHFLHSMKKLNLQITLEVSDLQLHYFKVETKKN